MMSFSRLPRRVPAACSPSLNVVSNTATFSDAAFSDMLSLTWPYSECLFGDAVDLTPILLARPSQFEGLTGAKPFRISEGYPRVFTTEKGGGDLFWRDLGGLDPGRRLRGECDPSLVQ